MQMLNLGSVMLQTLSQEPKPTTAAVALTSTINPQITIAMLIAPNALQQLSLPPCAGKSKCMTNHGDLLRQPRTTAGRYPLVAPIIIQTKQNKQKDPQKRSDARKFFNIQTTSNINHLPSTC